MNCQGDFHNDRLCEICKVANGQSYYDHCKHIVEFRSNMSKLRWQCPNKESCSDKDYYTWTGCKVLPYDSDGERPPCNPTPDCIKYVIMDKLTQ